MPSLPDARALAVGESDADRDLQAVLGIARRLKFVEEIGMLENPALATIDAAFGPHLVEDPEDHVVLAEAARTQVDSLPLACCLAQRCAEQGGRDVPLAGRPLAEGPDIGLPHHHLAVAEGPCRLHGEAIDPEELTVFTFDRLGASELVSQRRCVGRPDLKSGAEHLGGREHSDGECALLGQCAVDRDVLGFHRVALIEPFPASTREGVRSRLKPPRRSRVHVGGARRRGRPG
jgi:hypothetical protein